MKWIPYDYQKHAIDHSIDNPAAGLFLGMGLGKTAITLTVIDKLLFDSMLCEKPLIVAPKKVANHTWGAEIQKWDHLKHLTVSKIMGTEKERKMAIKAKADIYITSRDLIAWLITYFQGAFPFDLLILDELSSFKNQASIRFKAVKSVRPLVKRVMGLTGTPAPNGLIDLWAQVYLLDQGERLEKTISAYRTKYFTSSKYTPYPDYKIIKDPDPLIGADYYEKKIYSKVSDICISMKAEDYLDLPKRIDRLNKVYLPKNIMAKYAEFEKKLVLSLEETEIDAINAAVLTNKLLQFSNGAIYDEEKVWHEIHKEKLEALEEDIEAANGESVLIFYNFKHDLERILKHLKKYKPVVLKGSKEINDWNKGKIQILLAHPQSAGHGLNLQDGGHLIEWFGNTWGLEYYEQGIARLDRQGQTKPVVNTRIITVGTMDERVLQSLENKSKTQDSLMFAVKALIKKYK